MLKKERGTCDTPDTRGTLYYMFDFLHHLLFPRESNNHRAKILHHDSLLVLIAFLFFCSSLLSIGNKTFPSVLGITSNISIQDLLNDTNAQRKANGLAPLSLNSDLDQAAMSKAQNMFAENYWAHIAPDGTTPWYFIKNSGYDYLYAGENLARGFNSASDVVDAWMHSPSHRENLLSPNYTDIGFAVQTGTLTGSDTVLVVQMFGSKYIADNTNQQPAQQIAAVFPTPSVVISGTILPSNQPSPAHTFPNSIISPVVSPTQKTTAVAAIQSQPLIDSKSVMKQLSLALLFFFIAIFIADAIIIERKKIARVVAHNLDHIIFLVILVIAAIIIGRGLIL